MDHLPTYQLDEISLLRNLSEHQSGYDTTTQQHHHNQNQQQQQQQQQHQINASSSALAIATSATISTSGVVSTSTGSSTFGQFHGNIDILFQQNANGSPHINSYFPISSKRSSQQQIHQDISPHYQVVSTSTPQNDCFDQEDILTPLISPAITPSHNYRQQIHQKNHHHPTGNDINFSPLSSPAMLPHETHINGKSTSNNSIYHEQQQRSLDEISANQICEQYEQLEQAKILITQKLTELQKSQYDYSFDDRNMPYQRPDANDLAVGSKADTFVNQLDTSNFLSNSTIQLQQQPQDQIKRSDTSTIYSTHVEPATPASLMNMKRGRVRFNRSSPHSPPATTLSIKGKETLSPSMRSRMSHKKKLPITSNNNYKKKPRREYQETALSSSHISPRALKPLLISPTLNPNPRQSVPPIVNGSDKSSASIEDAERILATRSNYQNLMEGKAAALGIAFNSQIKSGLEVRRTAHKAAEQKRRDSLKEWFDRLRREVEEGYVKQQSNLMSRVIKAQELEKKSTSSTTARKRANSSTDVDEDIIGADPSTMKPLSKVLLLQYAYEYITSLKEIIAQKDIVIEQLKGNNINQSEMAED
ncbi:hypothetical protein K501DRAFT_338549 [Backusella circina FSU 941]|nr:hypothetical protein K501DRAFT_338549 [Backusella circina FSU 941]